jgi:hypothetical protein
MNRLNFLGLATGGIFAATAGTHSQLHNSLNRKRFNYAAIQSVTASFARLNRRAELQGPIQGQEKNP